LKRISILFVVFAALLIAACSTDQTSSTAEESEVATVEPTPEATPTATADESDEPSASEGGFGSDTALLDLLPDEIGGQSRTDVDLADNPMFAAALQGQGMDVDDVEYIISTWGTGIDVVSATAMRIPGMDRADLEQLARLMTGAVEGEASAEVVTIGGKEVLSITAPEAGDQVAYMYFVEDGVFVIGGPSEALAEELLSQLP
jgi:hypothetical protein